MSKELGKHGMQPSSSRRRMLLKQLGVSTTAGLFSGAALMGGISPVAAGDGGSGTTYSGPSVGTDEVIPAPDGAGITNAEWDATNEELDAQNSENLGNYPNAGELPIDYCITLNNGNDLCSDTADQIQVGTRDCVYGTTPELFSVDVTVQEYEYGSLNSGISFWMGYDADTDCLWVGQEDVGACSMVACDVEDALDTVLDYATTFVDICEGVWDWIKNNWQDLVVYGALLTAVALVGSALITASIIGGLIVAATSTSG